MENASKALLIAGGVLISIIIIALLLSVYNNVKDIPQQKSELLATEQVEMFNREFISYYKERLHGTDIITVMRKAMANNQKYMDGTDFNIEYVVNIQVKVNDDLFNYAVIYTNNSTTNKLESKRIDSDTTEWRNYKRHYSELGRDSCKLGEDGLNSGYGLRKGTYDLIDERTNTVNNKVWNFFSNEVQPVKYASPDAATVTAKSLDYAMFYPALSVFKRSYFTCTEVTYHKNTGRVEKMFFEQTT